MVLLVGLVSAMSRIKSEGESVEMRLLQQEVDGLLFTEAKLGPSMALSSINICQY